MASLGFGAYMVETFGPSCLLNLWPLDTSWFNGFRFGIRVVQAFGVLKLWVLGFKDGLFDEQEKESISMSVVCGGYDL